MNKREFDVKVARGVRKAFYIIKATAPVRSGNLKLSITLESTSTGWTIYIDDAKAPYDMYTNERWVSPQWKGRENPNLAWVDQAFDLAIRAIHNELGGTLEFLG